MVIVNVKMMTHRWRCPECLVEERSDKPFDLKTDIISFKHNIRRLIYNEMPNIYYEESVENYIECSTCGYRSYLGGEAPRMNDLGGVEYDKDDEKYGIVFD